MESVLSYSLLWLRALFVVCEGKNNPKNIHNKLKDECAVCRWTLENVVFTDLSVTTTAVTFHHCDIKQSGVFSAKFILCQTFHNGHLERNPWSKK